MTSLVTVLERLAGPNDAEDKMALTAIAATLIMLLTLIVVPAVMVLYAVGLVPTCGYVLKEKQQ